MTTAPASTPTYSPSVNLIPPTPNTWIALSGPLAFYNPTLLLIATALSQHAILFGILFLLRGFSAKRVYDLHYLTFLLALTLSFAGLVFLVDPALDSYKIFFLLEHEAVEAVIALRVLLPISVNRNHAGLILFCLWGALSVASIIISLSDFYGHGADLVAWGAFCTDFFLGVSGIVLVKRWFALRPRLSTASSLLRAKVGAEALAGVGYILHGFSTMCIGPIFVCIIYYNANSSWFAYGFAWVFMFALLAVALLVPVITIFFGTINWCCWHDRKVLPGMAAWDDVEDEESLSEKISERSEARELVMGTAPRTGPLAYERP